MVRAQDTIVEGPRRVIMVHSGAEFMVRAGSFAEGCTSTLMADVNIAARAADSLVENITVEAESFLKYG